MATHDAWIIGTHLMPNHPPARMRLNPAVVMTAQGVAGTDPHELRGAVLVHELVDGDQWYILTAEEFNAEFEWV